MPPSRFQDIQNQPCQAKGCGRIGLGRFCSHHRALYRYYGAPVAGPKKALLSTHQSYLKRTIGSAVEADTKLRRLIVEAGQEAFDPRPIAFKDGRGGMRWKAYEMASEQAVRIRQCHPGEALEELSMRLWWALMAVQYLELSRVFVHQDRHHFWTSVVRLMLTDAHRQKPSALYVDYLNSRLNHSLSAPAAHWCAKADDRIS
ncbi:hypothetical protein [Breoghania sp.]|uniref:hypothetical protein n=1 Tax=Breoghania sp. TaxID=2065378 RepID=UPI002AA9472A|nr:hypothetical protein [Breoghania sp.]